MLTHACVGTNDLDKAKTFYDATFGVLGVGPAYFDAANNRYIYMSPTGNFLVNKPVNGQPATVGNGVTIGLAMASAEQTNAWHAAGIANGGTTCEDPPGLRAHSGLYLAYLRDPDGNKLCALFKPE